MLYEMLSYPFMIRALIAGALIGGLCGILGIFVVLRQLAFFGEGVGHSSLLGIALALMIGLSPLFGALIFCVIFAIVLGMTVRFAKVREDTAIGILFSSSMALGIMLLSRIPNQTRDLTALLFGNLLSITNSDLLSCGIATGCIIFLLYLFFKELSAIVFDEPFSYRIGLPTTMLNYLLLVMLAVGIVYAIKLVGVILVSSLITVPAALALRFGKSLKQSALLSLGLGVAICESGIILSYVINTPPGATIVLSAGVLFLVGNGVSLILRKQ